MWILLLVSCNEYNVSDQRGNERYNPPALEAEVHTDIIPVSYTHLTLPTTPYV